MDYESVRFGAFLMVGVVVSPKVGNMGRHGLFIRVHVSARSYVECSSIQSALQRSGSLV